MVDFKKIAFREVTYLDAKLTLDWRTSHKISRFMNTDIPYDLTSQKKWITHTRYLSNYQHWIIEYDKVAVGFLSLTNHTSAVENTSWGFYVGPEAPACLGTLIPAFFYNWAFMNLKVKILFAEIFSNNTQVIQLHKFYGCKFNPEKDRIIKKNKKNILLITMSMSECDWNYEKYKKYITAFPIKNKESSHANQPN